MPLAAYYGGHGGEVAAKMKTQYGGDWERYFYGRAHATGQTPRRGEKNMKKSLKSALEMGKRGRNGAL